MSDTRIPDYAVQFADWNMISSIGAFGFGFAQLLFVWIVVKCVRGGTPATARVWDQPFGLEWTVPSPPPYHTFEKAPEINACDAMIAADVAITMSG